MRRRWGLTSILGHACNIHSRFCGENINSREEINMGVKSKQLISNDITTIYNAEIVNICLSSYFFKGNVIWVWNKKTASEGKWKQDIYFSNANYLHMRYTFIAHRNTQIDVYLILKSTMNWNSRIIISKCIGSGHWSKHLMMTFFFMLNCNRQVMCVVFWHGYI